MGSERTTVVTEAEDELIARVESRKLPPSEERRRIREAAGLTQAEVAEALEVDAVTVLRWERGARPRSGRIEAYARLLAKLDRASR
jgi:DNA-binding transcriptional regulator YiaG